MRVFVFQAALYCQHCGQDHRDGLPIPPGADLANESTFDSGQYPKGPYADGGGEADTPQHCDDCGTFLENTLTPDGFKYVQEAAEEFKTEGADESWAEIAAKAEAAGKPAVATWIRFYLAWGQ